MKYITVKNLGKYQHYKDRTPPWIKLHRDILNNFEFSQLPTASKAHLMLIWLLASQMDNKIPAEPAWIASRIGETKPVNLKPLINGGFISMVQDASEVIADCKQSAMAEAEREGESERESEKRVTEIPAFINADIWSDFVQHRKEKRASLKPTTMKLVIKDLTKWKNEGDDPNDILTTSIRNGWTGIFKPKSAKPSKATNGSSVKYVPDDELNAWASRNGAPAAKQAVGYTYDKYRSDLINWEQAR